MDLLLVLPRGETCGPLEGGRESPRALIAGTKVGAEYGGTLQGGEALLHLERGPVLVGGDADEFLELPAEVEFAVPEPVSEFFDGDVALGVVAHELRHLGNDLLHQNPLSNPSGKRYYIRRLPWDPLTNPSSTRRILRRA